MVQNVSNNTVPVKFVTGFGTNKPVTINVEKGLIFDFYRKMPSYTIGDDGVYQNGKKVDMIILNKDQLAALRGLSECYGRSDLTMEDLNEAARNSETAATNIGLKLNDIDSKKHIKSGNITRRFNNGKSGLKISLTGERLDNPTTSIWVGHK